MRAWKCDICGSLYENADTNSPENGIDPFTGEEINFYRKELLVKDRRTDYSTHDVCPDCMKRIEDFCKSIRSTKGEGKDA